MKSLKLMVLSFVCISIFFIVQTTFADTGKFYIVGMGTVPDLLTLRGVRAIEETQIIMLEDERDRQAWKDFIGQKEVWMVPNSARRYFGLDPEKITDAEMKEAVRKTDKNETLMSHQASMVFYTMFLDYPALFKDLNRHYPSNTPVAMVCNAGDRKQQKIIRSTVGQFLQEVNYKDLPVHMLLVGKFLTAGQARKDALVDRKDLLETHQ